MANASTLCEVEPALVMTAVPVATLPPQPHESKVVVRLIADPCVPPVGLEGRQTR